MTKEEKKMLRKVVHEILAERKAMPVRGPVSPVTEVTIRCGPAEDLRILGGFKPLCYGPPYSVASPSIDDFTDDDVKDFIKELATAEGESPAGMLDKLWREVMVDMLMERLEKRKYQLESEKLA